jgi:hypothetical protein
MDRIRDAAGMLRTWPRNALRHTAATYMADLRGITHAAEQIGDDPRTTKAHYAELVRDPAETAAFWAIRPATGSNLIHLAAG